MNSDRRLLRFSPSSWARAGIALAVLGGVAALVIPSRAAVGDYDVAQEPLYSKQTQPPLMMMVMSRDEQLFNKAYSDYSNLDEDANNTLETTYLDSFEYGGYFDSKLCYGATATGDGGVFKATAKASGANGHSCSGQWSGNFLNWITMSRLDVMRSVLYGGQRYIDTDDRTVIERARIPSDLHAWVKVYSGGDIGSFAPLSGTQSFCNVTAGTAADAVPRMLVSGGNWSEWASTAGFQCGVGRSGEGSSDVPRSATTYAVRAEVCAPGDNALRESYCRKYNDGNQDRYKPSGVLQTYGESGRLRFGLITGTYVNPRDGGTLRRNIGKIAGNSSGFCSAGDEIDLATGRFCYLKAGAAAGAEGVIKTISTFKIDQWNGSSNWNDCNTYGILNRQDQGGNGNLADPGTGGQKCSAWGNPLAEMYAEALRYVTAGTPLYGDLGDLSGLPTGIKWADPYRLPANGGNSYCATCNILVMSSGLPSFDSDNIGSVPNLASATGATDALGIAEGLVGKSFMAGRNTATPRYASLDTHEDICEGQRVSSLSTVRGICPDIPSMEGSYMLAGLAKAAAETDLRPGVQGKPSTYKVTATTYTVAMAENLPKFEINVGGGKIGIAPLCQANNNGNATAGSNGWRSCFLGAVGIGTKVSTTSQANVYGRPYKADGTAGSFSLVWEDSLWGNDHDNDVVAMLSYCVGATCNESSGFNNICWRADSRVSKSYSAANTNTAVCNGDNNVGTSVRGTVAADEVMIRIENLSAYAGNAMLSGYTITGSNSPNTVQRLALRPGNQNASVLTSTNTYPNSWDKPVVIKYKLSTGAAGQLESPLWYAAKYGVPAGGKKWDSKKAGVPDNYFLARNPTKLKEALEGIFDSAAAGDAPVGGSGTGARITTGSFTVSSNFKVPEGSNDWTGDVVGTAVTSDGTDGAELWRASTRISSSTRRIIMATAPTRTSSAGEVTAVTASEFTGTNVPGANRAEKLSALGFSSSIPTWFGTRSVDSLVGYLKGAPVSGLRTRSSPLGDIVNSSTQIVSNRDDYGYGSWKNSVTSWKQTLGTAYSSFLTAKKAPGGAPTVVYVGANDGMLHGFDASTGGSAGNEVMAFIPSASLQHIAELANPTYGHRYYVDGSLTSADVYYGNAWHSVLVGSTGGGGSSKAPNAASIGNGSVFGLNVDSPTTFGASNVLWEVSGRSESDMGFVLGKPVVVPVTGAAVGAAPRFVALFGNGVNSTSGKAVLFAVDIQTGKILKRLSSNSATYTGRNGLINIAPVALKNSDGVTDTVYGGDMQGNLWKYDLSDPNPENWSIALNGVPLFTAMRDNARQPITGGIEVTSGPGGGVSLFFGTGQYFAADDNQVNSASPVQSLYGIWDDLKTSVSGRTQLVAQTIGSAANSSGYAIRTVSRNSVSYTTKRGWYVDLAIGNAIEGERFVGNPNIQNGIVFFTTYVPGTSICGSGGGVNWLYGLNLLSGAGNMSGLSPNRGGDSLCSGDCGGIALTKNGDLSKGPPVRDTSIFVPPPPTPLVGCKPGDPGCSVDERIAREACTFVLRAPGADGLFMPRPCGRQSWRQIR